MVAEKGYCRWKAEYRQRHGHLGEGSRMDMTRLSWLMRGEGKGRLGEGDQVQKPRVQRYEREEVGSQNDQIICGRAAQTP